MDTLTKEFFQLTEENIEGFALMIPDEYIESDIYIGACANQIPCGILIANIVDVDVQLTYIHVEEKYRNNKVATGLLDTLKLLLRVDGYDFLYCDFVDLNDGLAECLKKSGFTFTEGTGELYSFKLKDIHAGTMPHSNESTFLSLQEVSSRHWIQLVDLCKDEFVLYERDFYDPQTSILRFTNGQVDGAILCSTFSDGVLINLLYSGEGNHVKTTYIMVVTALEEARKKFCGETIVYANATTRSIRQTIVGMVGRKSNLQGTIRSGYIKI